MPAATAVSGNRSNWPEILLTIEMETVASAKGSPAMFPQLKRFLLRAPAPPSIFCNEGEWYGANGMSDLMWAANVPVESVMTGSQERMKADEVTCS